MKLLGFDISNCIVEVVATMRTNGAGARSLADLLSCDYGRGLNFHKSKILRSKLNLGVCHVRWQGMVHGQVTCCIPAVFV